MAPRYKKESAPAYLSIDVARGKFSAGRIIAMRRHEFVDGTDSLDEGSISGGLAVKFNDVNFKYASRPQGVFNGLNLLV
jgi:hypothetical protein